MTSHVRAVLQALFVVFLWATSRVFVKIGLEDIPPVTFAGLRYFPAFLCLLAALLLSRSNQELRELTRREWLRFSLLGILLYAGTQGAVLIALAFLPAVTVNLLWSFSSVIIAILGTVFLFERPRLLQWAGIMLSIVGAIIYFYPVDIPRTQSIGFAVALLNTAFAFTLWNHTLRTLTAMESGIINGTMLVWIAIFAVLFLNETITPKELVGLAATGLGTLFVQWRNSGAASQPVVSVQDPGLSRRYHGNKTWK